MSHVAQKPQTTPAHNLHIRRVAHAELDKIIDSVDDIDDAYGLVRIEIPVQSGKLLRVEHWVKGVVK